MKHSIILFSVLLFIFIRCRNQETTSSDSENTPLQLSPSTPPFTVKTGTKFYKNVKYDDFSETVFDIFMPASAQPTALVIQIHGGGFKSGDKADNYGALGFQNEVNEYLSEGIAFASINYRLLLETNETEGVLKPLNDAKRALQFIRYYAKSFNINKTNIALKGGSAGAGTCLWLALGNDRANTNATDLVLRESTRVKAVVASNAQATYNLASWPTAIFSEYQPELSWDKMVEIATPETVMQFYGISNLNEVNTPEMATYNAKVDNLNFMTADDPDIYLVSAGIPHAFPQNKGNLIHHPLHAKALMDKANSMAVNCRAFIPEMSIDTTNGESAQNFLIRKLKGL